MANIFDFLESQIVNPNITEPSELQSTPVSLIGFKTDPSGGITPQTVSSLWLASAQSCVQGPQGTRGMAGTSIQGSQGSQGPTGQRGLSLQGARGAQGTRGRDLHDRDLPTLIEMLCNEFSASTPIGTIIMSTNPNLESESILSSNNLSAWLKCNGSSFSTSDYPDLATVIGTTYGGTEENPLLPNFIDRIPCGSSDPEHPYAQGANGNTITLTSAQMPKHSHQMKFVAAKQFKDGTSAIAMPCSAQGVTLKDTPSQLGGIAYPGWDQPVYTQSAGSYDSVDIDITPACTKVVFYIKAQ